MKSTCTESDCNRPHHARGLCSPHYWKAKGSGAFPDVDIRRKPENERFAAKWRVGPLPPLAPHLGPCHIWTAGCNRKGYGQFNHRPAHVVAWEWQNGPLPAGHIVDHRCFVHACVREDHLRAVTHGQNQQNRTGSQQGASSRERGVYWDAVRERWAADVTANGVRYRLGRFDTEAEAGEAARLKRLEVMTHNDLDRT